MHSCAEHLRRIQPRLGDARCRIDVVILASLTSPFRGGTAAQRFLSAFTARQGNLRPWILCTTYFTAIAFTWSLLLLDYGGN